MEFDELLVFLEPLLSGLLEPMIGGVIDNQEYFPTLVSGNKLL